MTAMCDVAFLLLTFFMLATKFKPEEPVEVKPPSSVSSKLVPDKDVLLLTFDNEGRVYMQLDNPVEKEAVIRSVNTKLKLNLSVEQMRKFVDAASMGVPFSQLSSFLSLPKEDWGNVKQPGIPVDSTNNQLEVWVQAVLAAYQSKPMNILLKGDNKANYKNFKSVVEVLKKNDLLKFLLITAPEDVPSGTALWKSQNAGVAVETKQK